MYRRLACDFIYSTFVARIGKNEHDGCKSHWTDRPSGHHSNRYCGASAEHGRFDASGNTINPVLSGQSTLLSARSELSVSPSTPTGLLSNTTGTNPLTGLPCTGPGSLSISGVGTLPGTTSPPLNGSDIGSASGSVQISAFPSVFQPGGTGGAC